MKLLVPVKRVVDYNVKIRVLADETGVDLANVKMSMNPFDEIAVEAAVRFKEAGIASEVIVLSIGADAVVETLRAGLAMGADRAIHIKTDLHIEPLAAASLIAAIAMSEKPDIIITGKQAIDDDANQTGQMLAAKLGWGQACSASKIDFEQGRAAIVREVDGGLLSVSLQLPCVITTDLRLNTPRYASLPNIMKARSRPVQVVLAEELGVDLTPRQKILKVQTPPKRQAGRKVANVDELVRVLQQEANIL